MGSLTSSSDHHHHHAIIFPFMSKGHTIPLLHLARLLHHRHLAVTIFTTPSNSPYVSHFLSNTSITIITLPFPQNLPGIPSGIESTDKLPSMSLFPTFAKATKHMQQDFERTVQTLPRVSFMVSDSFLWWTLESSSKFGFPRLAFYGMTNYAMAVSAAAFKDSVLFRPDLRDDELITIPTFPWIKISKNDFEPSFTKPDIKGPLFEFNMDVFLSVIDSYGLIVNSFLELEPAFLDYSPKRYCVGPLCLVDQTEEEIKLNSKCKPTWIQWLDQKLSQGSSVLYVAFGSQVEISSEQLKEIAIGLEESTVNFIWVMRKKDDSDITEEFEERVKERGIVVREWVDQMEILKHESVKGFLSHCGWNSALESICCGVPILAWPMMAEQPLNAKMVVEEIEVGLRVESSDGSVRGFVKGEGLKKMVKELMEGEKGVEAGKRVKKFAEMAETAMREAGSSWNTLNLLIDEICKQESDVSDPKTTSI